MSKTEILEELPKLTADERNEIRLRIAELDGDAVGGIHKSAASVFVDRT